MIGKVVDEGDFFEISETFAKNIVHWVLAASPAHGGFVANSRWCWRACSTATPRARRALRALL